MDEFKDVDVEAGRDDARGRVDLPMDGEAGRLRRADATAGSWQYKKTILIGSC